jgi:hypothetical protein
MKPAMPYLGVGMPELRSVCRDALAAHGEDDWQDAVLVLWRDAEYREERYAALWILRRHASEASLPLVEELVVEGRLVGLRRLPRPGRRVAAEDRPGRRRRDARLEPVARPLEAPRRDHLPARLQARHRPGAALRLHRADLSDRDFFIRKAIGWSLREYAKTDPDEVARYVREHADRLSPLSRREATKHLDLQLER